MSIIKRLDQEIKDKRYKHTHLREFINGDVRPIVVETPVPAQVSEDETTILFDTHDE